MFKTAQGSARNGQDAQSRVQHFSSFSFLNLDTSLVDQVFQCVRQLAHGEEFRFFIPIQGTINTYLSSGSITFSNGLLDFGHKRLDFSLPTAFTPPESIEKILIDYFRNHPRYLASLEKETRDGISDFIQLVTELQNEIARQQEVTDNGLVSQAPRLGSDARLASFLFESNEHTSTQLSEHTDRDDGRKATISNIPTVFFDPKHRNIPGTQKRVRTSSGQKSPEPYQCAVFDAYSTLHSQPRVKEGFRETILTRSIAATSAATVAR